MYRDVNKKVQAVLFIIAKNWKQCKCLSTVKCIKKMCYTHPYIYSNENERIAYTKT